MTTQEKNKIGMIIESKIFEFFGDPDSGLTLKKMFLAKLKKVTSKQLVDYKEVVKKYARSLDKVSVERHRLACSKF